LLKSFEIAQAEHMVVPRSALMTVAIFVMLGIMIFSYNTNLAFDQALDHSWMGETVAPISHNAQSSHHVKFENVNHTLVQRSRAMIPKRDKGCVPK
jgi:hypothetical protein